MADPRGRIRWTISLSLAGVFLAAHAAPGQTRTRVVEEASRLTITITGTGVGRVAMTTPTKLAVVSGNPIDLRPGVLVTLNPQATRPAHSR